MKQHERDFCEQVGKSLKALRESNATSINALSKISGVSRPTIYNAENGGRTTAYVLVALIKALRCDLDSFLEPAVIVADVSKAAERRLKNGTTEDESNDEGVEEWGQKLE